MVAAHPVKLATSLGTPEGTRTPDRWIRKPGDAPASSQVADTTDRAVGEDERGQPPPGPSRGHEDPVEAALANALERASKAGEWAVVAQLARELESRRLASRGGTVIDLERKKRER